MNFCKIIFFVVLISITTSCATSYKQPIEGSTARLYLPDVKSSYTAFGGPKSEGIRIAKKGENGCGQLSRAVQGVESVLIPAETDVFISYLYSFSRRSCSVPGGFFAEKNSSYRILINRNGSSCGMSLLNITDINNSVVVELEPATIDTLVGHKICNDN